jgi:hypothetical protein
MAKLPLGLPYSQSQTQWKSQLDPVVNNPLNNMSILPPIQLANGVTSINHLLGRTQQGWIIVDINGAATIYRSQPFNAQTLVLTSNAVVTVTLAVY